MKICDCDLINITTCTQEDNIVLVANKLKDEKQARLIVVNNEESPVGIISITDMNNKVIAENKDLNSTSAKDIMSSPILIVADIDDDVNKVYQNMMTHKSFFVPITKEGKLIGVLTYASLLKATKQILMREK